MLLSKDGGSTWSTILNGVKEANWDKLVHYEIVPDERLITAHIL